MFSSLRRYLAIFAVLGFLPGAHAQIQRIDIIHLSHMDVGFTDHPAVTREMQKKYLDEALDACAANHDFRWTVESLLAFTDWWQAASPARREQMLGVIGAGQLSIPALPLNNAPALDADEWRQMLEWIPEDLWLQLHPRYAVQDDVNGFPRAGALQLLNHGVHRLFMGMNGDSGGPPFARPTAFWWRMPDGRRLMVYLGDSYPAGYSYFHAADWRRGPVPRVADTAYRRPHAGDFFKTDEASLRQANAICLEHLHRLEASGYRYPTLVLPFSNQWRMDNDPPFPPLADFVAAWNRLGLKPELRLLTAADALEQFETEDGAKLPEYSGEWPDWWSNGQMSGPREVAATRFAKAYLRAAASPVFGAEDGRTTALIEELRKDLCLFDEHTWGAANSVAEPDSLETIGQFNEKARLAYRPMALAEWLLSDRARARLATAASPGFYVVNTAALPYTGWVSVPTRAMRVQTMGVDHSEPGLLPWFRPRTPADLTPENDAAEFPDNVPDQTAKLWRKARHQTRWRHWWALLPFRTKPEIAKDVSGWPVSVQWKSMDRPLFTQGIGDFLSVRPVGFAPRWVLSDMAAGKPGRVEETSATPGPVEVTETGHTIVYRQRFTHPSLRRGSRTFESGKVNRAYA